MHETNADVFWCALME
jgi:hypothetical protein